MRKQKDDDLAHYKHEIERALKADVKKAMENAA